MATDRITIQIDKDGERVIYTEAKASNFFIPRSIEQIWFRLEEDVQGYAVTRMALCDKLAEHHAIANQEELSILYTEQEWTEPITWLELAYLATFVFSITEQNFGAVDLDTTIPLCVRLTENGEITNRLTKYKAGMTVTEYLEDIRLGGSYMPLGLFLAYRLLQKKIGITDEMMFKQITNQNADTIERI